MSGRSRTSNRTTGTDQTASEDDFLANMARQTGAADAVKDDKGVVASTVKDLAKEADKK